MIVEIAIANQFIHYENLYMMFMFKAMDYVIRWGGEEFLILMPGCPVEQAVRVAELIREKVELSDNEVCKITVSIGVSEYNGGDYHVFIKEADEAMYEAKAKGRNQVVQYVSK